MNLSSPREDAGSAAPREAEARTAEAPGGDGYRDVQPELPRPADNASSRSLRDQLGDLQLEALFPLDRWQKDEPWKLAWVQWTLLFVLAPLVILHFYGGSPDLEDAAWAFGLYFCCAWGLAYYFIVRPEAVPKVEVAQVAGFTIFIGIPLVLWAQEWPIFSSLYSALESETLLVQAIGYIAGVGLLEEGVKALPILWLMRRGRVDIRTLVFLGAVSGLAFGVKEAVVYSLNIGSMSLAYSLFLDAGVGQGQGLSLTLVRLISIPFFHAAWSAIVAYFIGLAAVTPSLRKALILAGIAVAAVLHGLYDVFSGGYVGVLLAALTFVLFVSYLQSLDHIVEQLRTGSVEASPVGQAIPEVQTRNARRGMLSPNRWPLYALLVAFGVFVWPHLIRPSYFVDEFYTGLAGVSFSNRFVLFATWSIALLPPALVFSFCHLRSGSRRRRTWQKFGLAKGGIERRLDRASTRISSGMGNAAGAILLLVAVAGTVDGFVDMPSLGGALDDILDWARTGDVDDMLEGLAVFLGTALMLTVYGISAWTGTQFLKAVRRKKRPSPEALPGGES